jgi:CRISPR/Cas system CSM-associated protein Csm4 (group 5 of RAMP superfamily)
LSNKEAGGVQSEFWFAKNQKYYPKNLHSKLVEKPDTQGKSKNCFVKTLNGTAPVAPGSATA